MNHKARAMVRKAGASAFPDPGFYGCCSLRGRCRLRRCLLLFDVRFCATCAAPAPRLPPRYRRATAAACINILSPGPADRNW